MDTRENKQCPYFDTLPETIYHAFKECHYALVMERWHEVEIRLHEKINGNPKKSHTEKIYETNSKIKLIKLLDNVFCSKEGHVHKQKRGHSFLSDVKRVLYRKLHLKKYKAKIQDNIEKIMST